MYLRLYEQVVQSPPGGDYTQVDVRELRASVLRSFPFPSATPWIPDLPQCITSQIEINFASRFSAISLDPYFP